MSLLLDPESTQQLDDLFERLQDDGQHYVGYPCTTDFNYEELFRFLGVPINNVGDPLKDGTLKMHTHDFEREVVDWFAELLHAPADSYWGYVTNGGTEGNLYGLYLARELLSGGMCYYSEDTHYSVAKNLRVLNMQHIMLNSMPSGEIDYDDLRETLKINRHIPPIIFANIGTTMREGNDRIDKIRKILHDLSISSFYIHCDAALSGMTMPFIEGAPPFDFAQKVDSISISGHKFIGSPIPCGLVLADRNNVQRIARSIEYIGSLDTTITGSRNGLTPLILWYAIKRWGVAGFTERVAGCLENAEYAVQKFQENEIAAWRNPHAITVIFPRPPESLVNHWQIAVQDDIGHMLVMPNISKLVIDEFISDYLDVRPPSKP